MRPSKFLGCFSADAVVASEEKEEEKKPIAPVVPPLDLSKLVDKEVKKKSPDNKLLADNVMYFGLAVRGYIDRDSRIA